MSKHQYLPTKAWARLLWVLPTIIVSFLIGLSFDASFVFPAPFLVCLIGVIIAGAYGGLLPGILAGLISSMLVFYGYSRNLGPAPLTGGLLQATVVSVLFFLIGTKLGHLKSQRDASQATIQKNKQTFDVALRAEKAKRDEQVSIVEQSAARLAMAVRIAGIGHYKWNVKTGYCEFCSEQHAAHFGLTADEFQALTVGREPYIGYVHEDDREHFLKSIDRIDHGEAMFFEYRVHQPNGDIRFLRQIDEPVFNDDGEPVEVVGASIDLTDLREAEARVRQSQRIEAIGTLTGGVAHDFNNLLAIILGNLELSLHSKNSEDRRKLIDQAMEATERGASLTKNLLSFSRRAHLNPTRLNLNQLVKNTMTWSSRVIPATISIKNSLLAGLWDADLDSTSVENAIINILLNARDAMPDGGKVIIETANLNIGEDYAEGRDVEIEPGRYVMLAISDTGHGIEPGQLDRVFEPFYSNKPVGMGSGLGLSMVQGFLKQSGGAIRVNSEVGVGTTFKLYFKAAGKAADATGNLRHERNNSLRSDGNGMRAKVLLAEDEEEVMRILRRMLEDAGHHITTASTGDSALKAFNANRDFDLLVTDVVMPGHLQGPALAKAIREIQPDMPCVFLSGYASKATAQSNGLKPSDAQLMKPVKRADLLSAVSKALAERQKDAVPG